MTTAAFNLSEETNGGAIVQESDPVTIGAGEKLRVRFQRKSSFSVTRLKIVANGVTSYVDIPESDAWVTDNVAAGDVCSVSVRFNDISHDQIIGVVETF